jgi:hypothetical protein
VIQSCGKTSTREFKLVSPLPATLLHRGEILRPHHFVCQEKNNFKHVFLDLYWSLKRKDWEFEA